MKKMKKLDSIHRPQKREDSPLFFKEWGGVRKDMTGRELHGRTYDEMPVVAVEPDDVGLRWTF